MAQPGAGAGAIPPGVTIKNGPCVDCRFFDWDEHKCRIDKRPDEQLECKFFG